MGLGVGAVFFYLIVGSAILVVPAAVGLLLSARLGVESQPVQAIYALGAPCLLGLLAFVFYVMSPSVGRIAIVIAYTLTAWGGVVLWIRLNPQTTPALRSWIIPAGLAISAAAFSLGLGFLHGGSGKPLVTAATRYNWQLPSDNALPWLFARQLLSTHRPLPHYLVPGWLSSDRPPLQTGVYLLVRTVLPVADSDALLYQVVGTLLQCLWAPALWCLLRATGVSRRAIACGLSVVMLSGFGIVNSFFTWPKLFPAAFLVLLAAVVLTDGWETERNRVATGTACGLAMGLALLGHEGSALAGLPLVALVLINPRRWTRLQVGLLAFGTVVVLVAPWMLYQRYYDPPGNDLAKEQLAGQTKWNPNQGLVSAVADSYSHLDLSQVIHYKWENVAKPLSGEPEQVQAFVTLENNLFGGGKSAVRRAAAVRDLRTLYFYNLFPAVGLFVLGPLAQLYALRRNRTRRIGLPAANRMWALVGLILILWALVEFGPGTTVIHQGTYVTELLIFAAATIAFWSVSPLLLTALTVLQGTFGLALYGLARAQFPGIPSAGPIDRGELALSAAGH
jgi:hypothetical protein